MTKKEAVLVSAYTGYLLTKDFSDVHKFCEDLLGFPIWSHEFAAKEIQEAIREKALPLIQDMILREVDDEAGKLGRWILRGGWFHCSECDAKALLRREGGTGGFSYEYEQVKANFCPNCGAKLEL